MAVLVAIKSFPARPRHLGLGHVHDLLGLLNIGSSTFRGETIEIKPQDHIDVKHDSGRKIAGQRIWVIVQWLSLRIFKIQLLVPKIQKSSCITGIIDRTAGLYLDLALEVRLIQFIHDNRHRTIDLLIDGKRGIRPFPVIHELSQGVLQGREDLLVSGRDLVSVYRDTGVQLLRLPTKRSGAKHE